MRQNRGGKLKRLPAVNFSFLTFTVMGCVTKERLFGPKSGQAAFHKCPVSQVKMSLQTLIHLITEDSHQVVPKTKQFVEECQHKGI